MTRIYRCDGCGRATLTHLPSDQGNDSCDQCCVDGEGMTKVELV